MIAMTWGDIAVIGGVMFLVLAWIALRVTITFGRRQTLDRVHTPTIDRRNREALESMLSLDEIADQAASEPAPADLIDAVEHKSVNPENAPGKAGSLPPKGTLGRDKPS